MSLEEIDRLKGDVEKLRRELSGAKSQLAHNEMQIRTVINAIPVGLFIIGPQGKIEASNPYSLELFRCTHQDLVDRDIRELIYSEDVSKNFQSDRDFKECQRQELTAMKADGETFSGVRGVKFVVIIEDVSERRRIQALRDDFFAMISHDFHSPLQSIDLSTVILETILKQSGAPASAVNVRLMDPLLTIKNSSSAMLKLVNELLDLEKLRSAKFTFHFESVWLNTVIDQAVENVEGRAFARKILFEKKQAICKILADRDRLVQVLDNLLLNSIKLSPEGTTIEVGTQNFGNDVLITISTGGPVIPNDLRIIIFEKFRQTSKDFGPSQMASTLGLGLPICKAIVEGHGGSIGVRNKDGGGNIFWVRLPVRLEVETR